MLKHNLRQQCGRWWIVGAAVLWSTSGLFAKSPIFADWPPEARGLLLAFWRATFAATVLIPFIRRPRWRLSLVALAACFTAMSVSYLTSMTLTTAANAIWLQSTAPWWVCLLGAALFRERPTPRDLPPLVFAAAGVGLILAFEVRGESTFGVACGLFSGLAFGAVIVCMRRLSQENLPWLVALAHASAALILFPWMIARGIRPNAMQLLVLAGFGAVQMAVPYLMFVRGLRTVSSQEASLIGLLEPILLPCWVLLAWGERPAWWTLAGGALILMGLVMRYGVLEARWAADRGLSSAADEQA